MTWLHACIALPLCCAYGDNISTVIYTTTLAQNSYTTEQRYRSIDSTRTDTCKHEKTTAVYAVMQYNQQWSLQACSHQSAQ
jgi:hypothetical protein